MQPHCSTSLVRQNKRCHHEILRLLPLRSMSPWLPGLLGRVLSYKFLRTMVRLERAPNWHPKAANAKHARNAWHARTHGQPRDARGPDLGIFPPAIRSLPRATIAWERPISVPCSARLSALHQSSGNVFFFFLDWRQGNTPKGFLRCVSGWFPWCCLHRTVYTSANQVLLCSRCEKPHRVR